MSNNTNKTSKKQSIPIPPILPLSPITKSTKNISIPLPPPPPPIPPAPPKILAEASEVETSPNRLREIYRKYRHHGGIKITLTNNPNTPLETLLYLGEYHPYQLLQNPAFDLYLLSNPNLLAEIPEKTFISIIKLPSPPLEFILFALNNRRQIEIFVAIIIHHYQVWLEWKNKQENLYLNFYSGNLVSANLSYLDLSEFKEIRNINLSKSTLKPASASKALAASGS